MQASCTRRSISSVVMPGRTAAPARSSTSLAYYSRSRVVHEIVDVRVASKESATYSTRGAHHLDLLGRVDRNGVGASHGLLLGRDTCVRDRLSIIAANAISHGHQERRTGVGVVRASDTGQHNSRRRQRIVWSQRAREGVPIEARIQRRSRSRLRRGSCESTNRDTVSAARHEERGARSVRACLLA